MGDNAPSADGLADNNRTGPRRDAPIAQDRHPGTGKPAHLQSQQIHPFAVETTTSLQETLWR
jgi:hypothetical protein